MKSIPGRFANFKIPIILIFVLCIPLFVYLAFFSKEPVIEPEIDVLLGRKTVNALLLKQDENPVLSRDNYDFVYEYLSGIVNTIIAADEIVYDEIFKYDSIVVIDRKDLMKLSATPGGYLLISTGVLLNLKAEDHLVGMIGHEIAHAEKRHIVLNLQREFGLKTLLKFALLNTNINVEGVAAAKILRVLTQLRHTSMQEVEADTLSVIYLRDLPFACDGIAGYLKSMPLENQVDSLNFISNRTKRLEEIERKAIELNCSSASNESEEFHRFKQLLSTLDLSSDDGVNLDVVR